MYLREIEKFLTLIDKQFMVLGKKKDHRNGL